MPGASPGMVSKYTLAFSLPLWERALGAWDNDEQRMLQKVKERHDLWLTLLPRNTAMRPWHAAWTVFKRHLEKMAVPDFPGWLSLYKQDGSRKESPWFSEPLLAVHTLGVVWQNIQASALMLDRYSGNAHHLQLRQPWDLFSASASLETWNYPVCPYYPWLNNTTVGKNLGCHPSHCSLWSLIPSTLYSGSRFWSFPQRTTLWCLEPALSIVLYSLPHLQVTETLGYLLWSIIISGVDYYMDILPGLSR